MELPKNVTQIGETDKFCKVYVEDYVVSYMKQMNRMAEDKQVGLALYGRCSKEEGVLYNFIYGAAKLVYVQREVKHLSQAQNQEIERLHRKYFGGYEFIGYIILNGEMLEGIWLVENSGCRYVKGYACFYEKNDAMLAYMLDSRVEEAKPETVELVKYENAKRHQEERKIEYGEKKEKPEKIESRSEAEKRMRSMRFAAASMFVLLCLVSVVTLQSEGVNGETGSKIRRLFTEFGGKSEENAVEVMNGEVINTLVAEEQLADAIRQENENVIQNEEPTKEPQVSVTEPPIEAPTPGPTEVPTPAPTEEPIPTEPPSEPEVVPTQSDEVYETYVIKKGDTLLGISLKYYGSVKYVKEICALNDISNPDNIQMGQKILLP